MADCLFCGIASGEIPAGIVYRDDSVLAFRDIDPKAPVHILIIPLRHIGSLAELEPGDGEVLGHATEVARQVAVDQGVAESGFRLVVNTGRDAAQSVHHVHLHLLGGRSLAWPPG
ncbi:MAG: histidine triad nucleotide-binding protein [Deltaproteobacteria bacterium]|nr:histidine triad nucleotide-binding protein [Deltaproteobacteria bacterium]